MKEFLDHFRALSTRLDAERIAYNVAARELLDKINRQKVIIDTDPDSENAIKARAELRRLKIEHGNLKVPSFIDPLPDLESYARSHAKTEPIEPVEVEIPNGQTPLAVYNNKVAQTNNVLAEIQRVIAAPPARDRVIQEAAAQLDKIATPPRVVGGKLLFPRHVTDSNGQAITVVNTEGLLAWLHRDMILQRLGQSIESHGPGLTTAERSAKLGELFEKLTTALRAEAAAAMAAERVGQRVIRRRHVHPAILLGVKVAPAAVWDWFNRKRGV